MVGDLTDRRTELPPVTSYDEKKLVMGGRQSRLFGPLLTEVEEAAEPVPERQQSRVFGIGGLSLSPWDAYDRITIMNSDASTPPPGDDSKNSSKLLHLGDFSLTASVWRVTMLAPVVGAVAAGVALALLDLIGVVTHLAYFGKVGAGLVPPSTRHLGALSILIPVGGGAVLGAMAYWGSERIRGHGIPEAMETILVGGSNVEPRLAVLKPVSSAISIGTGGPFGAEGPIILTGGAFGSLIAQLFHFTALERRTLLVAGACAGMAAVFGTPVAATLLGVELLVFEWKPRTMVPIGISVATASILRGVFAGHHLIRSAPLFAVPPHGSFVPLAVVSAGGVGLACGLLAIALTAAVYGAEDAFKRLPIHWAYWPAIGGLVVGIGGMIDPRSLGVGYSTIGAELAGHLALGSLALLLVTKLVMWSVALGSGTSGGILAPLLLMGAALGGILAPALPGGSPGTWALIGMAGTLAGVTRSPFTSVVFAFELTRDTGSLLPLLVACTLAHALSSLVLKRSILTEKVARRGFHVVREYAVDPLEVLLVQEVMRTDVLTLHPDQLLESLRDVLDSSSRSRGQRVFPVLSESGLMTGIVTVSDVYVTSNGSGRMSAASAMRSDVEVAYVDETLRSVADRMAEKSIGALPVVNRLDPGKVVGVITEFDLLRSRQRQLEEERKRERILTFLRPGALPRIEVAD